MQKITREAIKDIVEAAGCTVERVVLQKDGRVAVIIPLWDTTPMLRKPALRRAFIGSPWWVISVQSDRYGQYTLTLKENPVKVSLGEVLSVYAEIEHNAEYIGLTVEEVQSRAFFVNNEEIKEAYAANLMRISPEGMDYYFCDVEHVIGQEGGVWLVYSDPQRAHYEPFGPSPDNSMTLAEAVEREFPTYTNVWNQLGSLVAARPHHKRPGYFICLLMNRGLFTLVEMPGDVTVWIDPAQSWRNRGVSIRLDESFGGYISVEVRMAPVAQPWDFGIRASAHYNPLTGKTSEVRYNWGGNSEAKQEQALQLRDALIEIIDWGKRLADMSGFTVAPKGEVANG